MRQNVVTPLGLITTPNPYGQYPAGALSQADGVSMRAPGELRTLPKPAGLTFTGAFAGDILWKMMPLDAGHIYSFTTDATGVTWRINEGPIGGTQNAATPPIGTLTMAGVFTKGRICPVRSRDRMLVNSTIGEMVCDVMAPANSSDRSLRFAGMSQLAMFPFFNSVTDGPIPPQVMVAYRCIMVREFADGYSVKSVPSPASSIWNNDSTFNYQMGLHVFWNDGGVVAGDIIEMYRTDGLNTNSASTDPGPSFKLINRYVLTASDISAGFVIILDNATCAAPFYTTSGRELYTNPGQEGELGANRQPDVCGATAVFKGYTFYGNLTERPQLTISVPAGITQTDTTSTGFQRTNHIGKRSGAGTITSGSAVITAIPAGQNAGVVPGQQWSGSSSLFPLGNKVVSTTSTTITMTSNASASSTTLGWSVSDVIEINTIIYQLDNYGSIEFGNSKFELTYSDTINFSANSFNSGDSLIVEPVRYAFNQSLAVRATNGANYSPPLPEINLTAKTIAAVTTPNLMRWSKNSEPEHVPADQETRVGSQKIISFVSTKDALWIFCTDGVFRLSGDAGVWRVDVVDPKCVLCAPQCATSLHETVYAYTNYGFVSITDAGVAPISLNRVTELLPGAAFAEVGDMIVDRDPQNHEVLISLNSTGNILYIYNTPNDAFTRIGPSETAFNNIAAITFQDNPASGAPVVVLGFTTNVGPAMAPWNAGSAFAAPNVQYRNIYGDDPASQKQWISATYIFNANDSGKVISTLAGGLASGVSTLRQSFNDAYCTCGIIRGLAIAPSITPGWSGNSESTQTEFRGVSLYLVEYTQQPWRQK